VLRRLNFEARLKLPHRRKFRGAEGGKLQRITAECNGHALYCLRSALDYIEATPADQIDIRGGYLGKLTAHEKAQERRLTGELRSLYSAFPEWTQLLEGTEILRSFGGFDNAWTLAPQDAPAAG